MPIAPFAPSSTTKVFPASTSAGAGTASAFAFRQTIPSVSSAGVATTKARVPLTPWRNTSTGVGTSTVLRLRIGLPAATVNGLSTANGVLRALLPPSTSAGAATTRANAFKGFNTISNGVATAIAKVPLAPFKRSSAGVATATATRFRIALPARTSAGVGGVVFRVPFPIRFRTTSAGTATAAAANFAVIVRKFFPNVTSAGAATATVVSLRPRGQFPPVFSSGVATATSFTVVPSGIYPPTVALVDPFDDGLVNPQWSVIQTGGGIVQESGVLTMITPTTFPATAGYLSVGKYDLSSAVCLVHVATPPPASSHVRMEMVLTRDSLNSLSFRYEAGVVTARKTIGGTGTVLGTVTYSQAQNSWWRIRELRGTVYWDVSPDGISWTTIGTDNAPFPVASGTTVKLHCTTFQTEATSISSSFDNLNIVPLSSYVDDVPVLGAVRAYAAA